LPQKHPCAGRKTRIIFFPALDGVCGKLVCRTRDHLLPGNKAGAVSLTFDDALDSHLSIAIPALNARGMKGTFFLITNKVTVWDPWKSAALAGHEIGSHTKSHPYLTSISLTQAQDEIAGARSEIDARITSQKCYRFHILMEISTTTSN